MPARPKASHLYWRIYRTKSGRTRTLFYVRFQTWQGQLLRLPAGDSEAYAVGLRDHLRGLNTLKYDFFADPLNHLGTHTDLPALRARQAGSARGVPDTLQKWINRFLFLKKHKKSIEKDKGNAARLLHFFAGGGNDAALTDISTARIEDYKVARAGEQNRYGRSPQPATINRELALLRSILRMAYEQDALDKLPKIRLLPEHNERIRTATRGEFERLLRALAHRPEVCDVLEILWEQGLRENEVVSLRWQQIDLEAQMLHFPPLSTKTKEARQPPMSPRTYEILKRRAENMRGLFVFTTKRGGCLKPRWFKRLVSQAMSKAGIRGLWVHDLRGTFISRKVFEEGYDRELVKEVTGHATNSAFERYLRPSAQHMRAMLQGRNRYEAATQDPPSQAGLDN
jgi:integrase